MTIESEKAAKATEIIRQYMFGSVATKIMPSLPILDDAVECEVQLRLVHALAKFYNVDYSSKRTRCLLDELVGVGPSGLAAKIIQDLTTPSGKGEQILQEAKAFLGGSVKDGAQELASRLIKTIVPGARIVLDIGELAEAPAVLYAIGGVFIKHFETGGTLQDFDASLVKEQFENEILIGHKIMEISAMKGKS